MRRMLWALFLSCAAVTCAQDKSDTLTGHWVGTFADSISTGTLQLDIVEQPSGILVGTYTSSLGGGGKIEGRRSGDGIEFVLTQTLADCPGSYNGALDQHGEGVAGHYIGKECQGDKKDGTITLSRGGQATSPSPGPEQKPVNVIRSRDGMVLPGGHVYVDGKPFWLSVSESQWWHRGYSVIAAAREDEGYLQVEIGVANNSDSSVTFDPRSVTALDLLQSKPLQYFSPEDIAKRIRRRLKIAAFLAAFGANMSSAGTRTTNVEGDFSAYDYSGGGWVRGTFTGSATTYQPPDYGAGQAAANRVYASGQQRISKFQEAAATTQTLFPKDVIVGNVYFERPKKDRLAALGIDDKNFWVAIHVPVGSENFVFWFPVEVMVQVKDRVRQSGQTAAPR